MDAFGSPGLDFLDHSAVELESWAMQISKAAGRDRSRSFVTDIKFKLSHVQCFFPPWRHEVRQAFEEWKEVDRRSSASLDDWEESIKSASIPQLHQPVGPTLAPWIHDRI